MNITEEKAKHDTGGFRISDEEARKAKARLKKKYGKYSRHFKMPTKRGIK